MFTETVVNSTVVLSNGWKEMFNVQCGPSERTEVTATLPFLAEVPFTTCLFVGCW